MKKNNKNLKKTFRESLDLIKKLKKHIEKNGDLKSRNFFEGIYPLFSAYKLPEIKIDDSSYFGKSFFMNFKSLIKFLKLMSDLILSLLISRKTQSKKVEILFLNYSKRHLNEAYYDLIPHLKDSRKIYVGQRDECYDEGVFEYINIKKLISLDLFISIIKEFTLTFHSKKILLKNFYKKNDDRLFKVFKYEIILLHNFQHIVYKHLSKKILKKFKPSLIVTADDNDPRCRSMIITAKENNIKSLLIQQGLSSEFSVDYSFFLGDHIAAINEISKKHLIDFGVNINKITVTGRPSFSRLKNNQNKFKRNILFTSQPSSGGYLFKNSDERKLYLKTLYGGMKGLENVLLRVKPHPDEEVTIHEKIKKKLEFKNLDVYNSTHDTNKLLNDSDFLISFGSTTIIEGVISKSIVMIFDPFERLKELDYFNGNVPIFNDIKLIASEITNLIKNEDKYIKYLNNQNEKLNSYVPMINSAESVSKLIKNLN
tara:strand:- start:1217 stop:2665 length:1449 start_codon:yes stop_codon:yes gene_type:complete